MYVERTIIDASSGQALCAIGQTLFRRADGGFGGQAREVPSLHQVPGRPADVEVVVPTLQQAALLYRLSGDLNPLHADPEVAIAAGFERPILHGLATLGIAAATLLRHADAAVARQLKSIACRFTAPVYPGEELAVAIWTNGARWSFQVRAVQRNVLVIDNGRADFGPQRKSSPMPTVIFINPKGHEHRLNGTTGTTLMQLAQDNLVPGIPADCGGYCSCATCHAYVEPPWDALLPPAGSDELDMLQGADSVQANSRLTLQLTLTDEMDGVTLRVQPAPY